MGIIELEQGDAHLYIELRLRALEDVPSLFVETYKEASAHDNNHWASVYALLYPDDTNTGIRGCMWPDSNYRHKGVGRKLFLAHRSRARESGLPHIKLWVYDIEIGAKAFYIRSGFEETDANHCSNDTANTILREMSIEI